MFIIHDHSVRKVTKDSPLFVEILSLVIYNKNIDRIEKIVVLQAGGNYGRTV